MRLVKGKDFRATISYLNYMWVNGTHYVQIGNTDAYLISANGNEIAQELESIAHQIRSRLRTNGQPGIIRGDMTTDNQEFIFDISIDDIDQAATTAEKWSLLIQHFSRPGSPLAEWSEFIEALKAGYREAAGKNYKPVQDDNGQTIDQLQADLTICRAHHTELIQNGQPAWGAQSKVADLLDLPNTGGAYRQRILDVLEELQSRKAA